MAILGLLLLVCAAGLAVNVVLENTSSINVDVLGASYSLSPGWLFVAGIATGVIGLLGASILVAGMTRARRRRAALAESSSSVEYLQAERDRLAVELERERSARTPATANTGRHEGRDRRDDDSSVIDLGDERRSERTGDDYTPARSAERETTSDRRDPVESGRHGLFHRRN